MSTLYPDLQNTLYPNAIQSFVTMLNMTVADGAAVAGYQQAMQNGDTATAQMYYGQITNANQKFIDATKMNTLMDTCVALQRFYNSDIQPYVTQQQAGWDSRINQFNYIGRYSNSTQYLLNNLVLYNLNGADQLYICIAQPPIATTPTNTNYWRVMSIRGLQGESGTGVAFRYTWSSAENYYAQDVVTYDNGVWCCVSPNINQPPSSDSAYWTNIYSPQQTIYPFQANQPTGMQTGYLWFKII